jgi:hypothetical protein
LSKQLFLSGEGEALCLDFSENPIIKREIENMLKSGSQGFAIEVTCQFPEAVYGIQGPPDLLPDSGGLLLGSRGRFVPDIFSWDMKDSETSGAKSRPRPLIALTYRGLYHSQGAVKFTHPLAPSVEVANRSDQEDSDPIVPPDLQPWYLDATTTEVNRYDLSALWVGRRVTMQLGIQSTGTTDEYDVYLALSPKDAFAPQDGDPNGAEFALWTDGNTPYDASVAGYFDVAHLTIRKKDIFRSVVTIGGGWTPRGLGYAELNCRMIVDEVRVFATAGPGSLPATSGAVVTNRDGKLEGSKCLPPRKLEGSDILLELGSGVRTVNVSERSSTVAPGGGGRFFTGEPEDSVLSVKETYLKVEGDEEVIPADETLFERRPSLHRIGSVATDGSSLTLESVHTSATRSGIRAGVLRLFGYTDFEDRLIEGVLALGTNQPYDPASSTSADIQVTEPIFRNLAPIGEDFRIRIFQLGSPTKDFFPQWTRGLLSPRRGKIGEGVLGIATVNEKVYAAVRGSLYEGDDRWRERGPSVAISKSLAFRSSIDRSTGLAMPLQADALEFSDPDGLLLDHGVLDTAVTFYDAWLKLDEIAEYQTVMWVGDRISDPSLPAGPSTRQHRVSVALRLNRGRPELAIGSDATYAGGSIPEKGLFVATGSQFVQPGKRVHVRFYLETRAGGTILKIPHLKLNGKEVGVTVNAVDEDASITDPTDWLRVATIVAPTSEGQALFGIARDSFRSGVEPGPFFSTGPELQPSRIQGFLHSLDGELSEVVIGREPIWSGSEPDDFDPFALDYTLATLTFRILGALAEGRGAKVLDQVGGAFGLILSHPFISMFHEMGLSDDPVSFARHGQQLYATNGARPVLVQNGKGKPAGVEPPALKPEFALQRFPAWKPNIRDKTSASNPTNDPVDGALAGASQRVYHYHSAGNTYVGGSLAGADLVEMTWEQDDYFAFKCLVRMDSVSGRIVLFRKGVGKERGGPFVECRDGKLYIGWYDVDSKQEFSVHTDRPVFEAGRLHLVHVRKMWPQQDSLEGNFRNSHYTDGLIRRMTVTALAGGAWAQGDIVQNAGLTKLARVIKALDPVGTTQTLEYIIILGADFNSETVDNGGGVSGTSPANTAIIRPMHDVAVVRVFPTVAPTDYTENEAKPAAAIVDPAGRALVSLTSDYGQQPTGTTATGLVTPPGVLFTGTAGAGVVTSADALPVFAHDMIGMFWQWGSAAGVGADIYRVSAFSSSSSITVETLDGTAAPAWAGVASEEGGVFAGTTLVKSEDFDDPTTPDNSESNVEMFGSSLASDPSSGYAAFSGEFWCPAFTMETSAAANPLEGAMPFENRDSSRTGASANDPLYVGQDRFPVGLYDGLAGEVGELRADDDRLIYGIDLQTYASSGGGVSTQPDANLKLPKDTDPVCRATSFEPSFRFLQALEVWKQKTHVACAFYDPEQGVTSNPGPILHIDPASEDKSNPSGTIRMLLSQLPISRDPGEIELHIFKSLSVKNPDGSILSVPSEAVQRRVARVPSGTDEAAIQALEDLFTSEPLLQFNNGMPPACKIIATAQARIFYAALTELEQLDGIRYSKAFLPVQVPEANFFRINVGPGDTVTGLAEMNGLLVALMRRSVFAIEINEQGLALQKIVTDGAGCVAQGSVIALDRTLLWYGDRGLYVYQRQEGATEIGNSNWAGERLKHFFANSVDRQEAHRASAGVNRVRHQYVLAFRGVGEQLTDRRVSFNGMGFGLYRDPNVTALCDVQPEGGGPPRLVAGTEEGFLVWMDDTSTQLLLLGPVAAADGAPSHVADAGSTSSTLLIAGVTELDGELEGMRGSVVRWQVAGVDYQATVLGVDGRLVHLDSEQAVLPPLDAVVTVGEQRHVWESKWFDLGNFEKRKRLQYMDLELAPVSTGQVDFYFYVNRNGSVFVKRIPNIPMNGSELQLTPDLHGNHAKVRIVSSPLVPGANFEITGITLRPGEIDQH